MSHGTGAPTPTPMDRCQACHAPTPPETPTYRQPDGTWRFVCVTCGQWQTHRPLRLIGGG